MKTILIIILLLIPVNVYAGYYVFHTNGEITGKNICGRVCRLRPDSISVDVQTYNSLDRSIHKVVNDVVVNKTQAEIDTDRQVRMATQALAEVQAQEAKDEDLANTDLSNINLPKVEAKIDAINNMAQLKVFLKRLVRYISTIQSGG